ncbi:hypothetical protein HMI55_007302 [Coelomomyces lativittatus]|nr:hypothetical protein HMI55_007302 [Coelomomyces lativittatus]
MENGSSFLDRWIKVQYRETPEARTPKKVPPPLPLQLPTPGMNRVAREEVEHTEHLRYPMTFQQTSCNRGFPLPTTTDLSPVSPTDFTLESGRYFRSGFRPTTFAHTSAPASPSPPSSPLHLTFPLHCRASSSPHIRMPMNFPTTSMHFPSYFTSATGHLDSSTPAISSSSSNSNTATTTTTTSTSTSTSTTTPSQSQSPSPTPSPSSSSSMSSNTSFHTRQHSSGSIVGINLSSQPPTASTYVGGPPSRYPNFEMNLYNVPDVDDKSKSGSVPEAYE